MRVKYEVDIGVGRQPLEKYIDQAGSSTLTVEVLDTVPQGPPSGTRNTACETGTVSGRIILRRHQDDFEGRSRSVPGWNDITRIGGVHTRPLVAVSTAESNGYFDPIVRSPLDII